jgi:hypothetical protein
VYSSLLRITGPRLLWLVVMHRMPLQQRLQCPTSCTQPSCLLLLRCRSYPAARCMHPNTPLCTPHPGCVCPLKPCCASLDLHTRADTVLHKTSTYTGGTPHPHTKYNDTGNTPHQDTPASQQGSRRVRRVRHLVSTTHCPCTPARPVASGSAIRTS